MTIEINGVDEAQWSFSVCSSGGVSQYGITLSNR